MRLNEVYAAHATREPGVYIIQCNITDAAGETYDAVSVVRPNDPHGLNPILRKWMEDNPGFTVGPYPPPIADKTRAAMSPLPVRQLRLGLFGDAHHEISENARRTGV